MTITFYCRYKQNFISFYIFRIRGKLGSFVSLSVNLGMLLGFFAGHYLAFVAVPKYALWLSVISFVTFIFFPESPLLLVRKGKLIEAVKALQFYRNSRQISDQKLDLFRVELAKLISTREDSKSDTTITWKDFRKFMKWYTAPSCS